jgi:hypothetical protein
MGEMLNWMLLAVLTFQIRNSEYVMKWNVDIYLTDSSAPENGAGFSQKSDIDYTNPSFISDCEILGYRIIQCNPSQAPAYSIVFNDSAKHKLSKLDIPVYSGRHFVITVNQKPVLDGYFGVLTRHTAVICLQRKLRP